MSFDPPIFITCRDRVNDLRLLVAWLERAGHQRITLVDNASTYPPLLEFYEQTPHQVVRLGENLGNRAVYQAGLVPDERWVLTDPDVVPITECPLDAVAYLNELMDRFRKTKVGLGLCLDGLPRGEDWVEWEYQLLERAPEWRGPLAPGVFDSLIDTTFALYDPKHPHRLDLHAIRTGRPYQAWHMPWYRAEPLEDESYYYERALGGQHGSVTAARVKRGMGYATG